MLIVRVLSSSVYFVEILFPVCLCVVYRGEFKSICEDGDVNGSGKYHPYLPH